MDHQEAASYLLAARETGPGAPLPDTLRPATEADAYATRIRAELTRAGLDPERHVPGDDGAEHGTRPATVAVVAGPGTGSADAAGQPGS